MPEDAKIHSMLWVFMTIILIIYMGFRPDSIYFGDSVNYVRGFNDFVNDPSPFRWSWDEREWLFTNIMNIFAKITDFHKFFFFCALVYVGCLWWACVRLFKSYYFIPLLITVCMFTFWNYGVNGIRNGMGASVFILAMTFVENLPVAIGLAVISFGFHSSVYLLIFASIVAWFYKDTKYYLLAWLACIIVSFTTGTMAQDFISNLGIMSSDDRFAGYLTRDNLVGEVVQTSTSFRWDFIAYSMFGIVSGYYFIMKRNFQDDYYKWIFHIFVITNSFWILVIRAAYSNRFAQISWFIMPLVLAYPFLKKRFWDNHEQILAYVLLGFYSFTFYFKFLR